MTSQPITESSTASTEGVSRGVGEDGVSSRRNLRINTVALVASNLATGVLGLAFWALAARLVPPREVGIAAAVITSAVMVSTLSIVGIDTLYERFLPVSGNRAKSLLNQGFFLVAVLAGLAGVAVVVFAPGEHLFQSGWAMAGYPLVVMVLAVFTLQDKACAGLGVARWAAVKNLGHAAVKLVALFLLGLAHLAGSIVLAWTVTAAVLASGTLIGLHRRAGSHSRFRLTPRLPPPRQVWSYFGSSSGIAALWTIGPLVVPFILIAKVGPEANAYFAVAWAMISALYLMMHLVMSPYVAETAAHPDHVLALSYRMVGTQCLVAVLASSGLLVFGPLMLGLAGEQYRTHGQSLLHLAAAFLPLAAVVSIYEGFARTTRKMRLVLAVQALSTTVIVVGSLLFAPTLGVQGVGWSYLIAESLSAAILIGPVIVWLRRVARAEAVQMSCDEGVMEERVV
ncbi:MAG: lipopolysaccharide biosynthesis protein [Mycobacterium sp.]